MRIITRHDDQDGNFLNMLETIDKWRFAIVLSDVPGQDARLEYDFWLGSSRDGNAWALGTTLVTLDDESDDSSVLADQAFLGGISAILYDPPKRNEETIIEILARVWNLFQDRNQPDAHALEEIVGSVPFPEYPPVEHYLPEAPEDWLHLPSTIAVEFNLSGGISIGAHTYDEFRQDSMADVLSVLCGEREHGLLIEYAIVAKEVIPFLTWEVDWPLSRHGKEPPYRRGKAQGELPWETSENRALISIRQSVRWVPDLWGGGPCAWSKPSIRLRVGGRSPEDAIENWQRCARVLRGMKREVVRKLKEANVVAPARYR